MNEKAVVLLSGGLDSATVLAIAKHQGYRVHALSFLYGQRHAVEWESAQRVAQSVGVEQHLRIEIDLAQLGGSALTDHSLTVPTTPSTTIPITYVPARNTVFLAYALAWAEVLAAPHIFIGVNAVDYSGYPDCRLPYIEAFTTLANLATKASVEGTLTYQIHTPLIHNSKAEIIRHGLQLGVDYSLTHSCYNPDSQGCACGQCDSCRLRLKGFAEAGVDDPIVYAPSQQP